MLILGMTIPLSCRGLENMGRWRAAGWNAPSAPLIEKRCLRLRPCQAKLTGIGGGAPGGVIGPQGTEAFSKVVFG